MRPEHGLCVRLQTVQSDHGHGEREGFRMDPQLGEVLPEEPAERDAKTGAS